MLLNILLLQNTAKNCTGCFWCWAIWMLASALLGLFLGKWIWGKYKSIAQTKEQELKRLRSDIEEAKKEYVQLKYQFEESEKDNQGLKASLEEIESDKIALSAQLNRKNLEEQKAKSLAAKLKMDYKISNLKPKDRIATKPKEIKSEKSTEAKLTSTNTESTEEVVSNSDTPLSLSEDLKVPIEKPSKEPVNFGNYFKENNLQIIEGIGPKIEGLLQKAGYENWSKIAAANLTELKDVLHDAGPRYRIHNPKKWSQQAALAVKGQWEELFDLQQQLIANNEETANVFIPTKIEKLIAKKFGFSITDIEDLKIVEGIGPQIESLLKENDIKNWEDLANCPVSQLNQLLTTAGEKYRLADPATWSEQAQFAHQKKWITLKEFQDQL